MGDTGYVATIDPYLIDPANLRIAWTVEAPPFACLDLDSLGTDPGALRLPPFPIIGIGDPAHPAARLLDTVVEAPVRLDRIVEQVTRHPFAAAAVVQLLRATEGMAVDHALAMESICYAMLQGSAEHTRWIEVQPPAEPAAPGRIDLTREGATLRIVIDRPGALNAIDRPLRDALFEAFTLAELDPDIARVELRSIGRTFSTGADLAEFGTTRDPATAHHIRGLTLPAHPLSRCGTLVDVHVQGACIGSALEMAAFAGRVTASPSAWFQLPELVMGVIPGAGGCVSIPRRIGRQRAALMILSGKRIDAGTALRWGLIDAIMDQPPVDPGGAHAD
jgi:enoyl-CoA hydratase/carnithine racemase